MGTSYRNSSKSCSIFYDNSRACQLVLETSSMGNGGEIFVFDMGKSMKIIDLAHKMIQLAGLEVGKDIDVEIIGLRPGEKKYEETQIIVKKHLKLIILKS